MSLTVEQVAQRIQQLPPYPFPRVARDDGAQIWRKKQDELISLIIQDAAKKDPEVTRLDDYDRRRKAVAAAVDSFYAPTADPLDRTALIAWLGATCEVLDREEEVWAMSTAHVFSGRLFQAWTAALWTGVPHPPWADELLQDLFLGLAYFGRELTAKVAVDDIQVFLEAHKGAEDVQPIAQLRGKEHAWNRNVAQASIGLRVWASDQPEVVPESLVRALECLEKNYEIDPRYLDAYRHAAALWDRHLLEGGEEQAWGQDGAEDTSSKGTDPKARPRRL